MPLSILPHGLLGWWDRRRALRDLGRFRDQEEAVLSLDDANLVNRAKVALDAGDRDEAARCWDEAMTRYPHFAKRSRAALDILLGLQRLDEVEALMVEGQKREPRVAHYAGGYALVAQHRGSFSEAARRWARVRRRYPTYWMGYVNGACCLRRAGQADAADALLKKATREFPRQLEAWWEWALLAEEQSDWEAARQRWEKVSDLKNGYGPVGAANALAKLGRLDEAGQRLKEALSTYPTTPEIAISRAKIALQRGEIEEAVAGWADMRRRFPRMQEGYQEAIKLLRGLGRYADAEAVAHKAIEAFPEDAWPALELAAIAHEQ